MKIKKITIALILLALALYLSACGNRYSREDVISELDPLSEISSELCEKCRMLSVNDIKLPSFSGTKEGSEKCRDAILNYLLVNNYTYFSGNREAIEKAGKYANYRITCLIPRENFENAVYLNFGGDSKVSNKSGGMFTYISQVEAYTTIINPVYSDIAVEALYLAETENTYRLKIKCSAGNEAEYYEIVFVKRKDGTNYFYSVKNISDKIN